MTLVQDNIIYDLNTNNKTATIIKCISHKYTVFIPKKVKVDTSNNQSVTYDVKKISAAAFRNCRNIERIFFESNNKINQIEKNAFENCISLKTFHIPRGIKDISESCFAHCINLEEIKSESSINEIGKSAFEDCIELKSVEGLKLNNLNKISECAFKNCHKLSFNKTNNSNQNRLKQIVENFKYSSAKKKYIKSISKTDKHIPIKVNNLRILEPKAFENCDNINLTGISLSYTNGELFDSIHNAKGQKWEYPNNKFWFLIPFLILALYSVILPRIQSQNYAKVILFLLFSVAFFMLIFPLGIYKKHKRSLLAEAFQSLVIAFSFFFLIGVCTCFLKPDTNIFKTVSLIHSDSKEYYEIKPDLLADNESDFKIKSVVCTETSHDLSASENNKSTIQNLLVENSKETLIKVTNFLSDKNKIYEAELNYNNNTEKLIMKTSNPSIKVYIQHDNHQPVQLEFNKNNISEVDIKKYNHFDIFTADNIDDLKTYDYFLKIDLFKTAYTANDNWLIGVIGIIAVLMFIFLIRTFELLLSQLKRIQPIIAQNKIFFSIITFIMSVIFSVLAKDWLADFSDRFSSMISQY